MVWFKVDDTLAFHSKVMMAGNSAMGLWVRAGSWSSQHLTDGFVPAHVALAIGVAAEVEHLVAAGLWTHVEGGFLFHEWEQVNPTAEEVTAQRKLKSERQQRWREASRDQAKRRREITADVDGLQERLETPTRPDPTRTLESSNELSGARSPRATKRATSLPKGWAPTDSHREYGGKHNIDVAHEAEKFRAHHEHKGTLGKDWDAGFRNWLIKAVEYRDERAPKTKAAPKIDRSAVFEFPHEWDA